jgi:hypothetical protein
MLPAQDFFVFVSEAVPEQRALNREELLLQGAELELEAEAVRRPD